MALLIVPSTLAAVMLAYGTFDRYRQLEIERMREEAQAASEMNIINEQILQAYFDDMAQLILDYDLGPETLANVDTLAGARDAHVIARARTLAALSTLDGRRNGILLRFLLETDLFDLIKTERLGIDLRRVVIVEYDLCGASLNRSDLREAVLVRTDLSKVVFMDANLSDAQLIGADLSDAVLFRADLSGADLSGANLEGAYHDASTTWPEGFDPSEAGAVETTLDSWIEEIAAGKWSRDAPSTPEPRWGPRIQP
jgi:uncharacterized protein YjbI with pentapeptide repeats